MDKKTIKRILFGLLAVGFLFVGGRELVLAGFSLKAMMAGGAGLILAFSAITGAG
ncbi:MAG: hypothetical protein HY656_01630 [Acidobacteria bacterium]|nr:hypothetical protein [Acidobacteriota bacterium]